MVEKPERTEAQQRRWEMRKERLEKRREERREEKRLASENHNLANLEESVEK